MQWTGLLAAPLLWAAMIPAAGAAPLKILAIGDSLTEEYRFETVFSGPASASGIPPLDANTRNWPEILDDRRDDLVTLGSYEPNIGSYPDFRDGGYKYNYGVPSFTTANWIDVVTSTISFTDPYRIACYSTKTALRRHLQDDGIGVVVILLGGNDLKAGYSEIYNAATPPALLQGAVDNLRRIQQFVRTTNATVPVVLCTMPDVGATPEVTTDFADAAARGRARQWIAETNGKIIALAAETGCQVARVDSLTNRIYNEVPFYLNGTLFKFPPADPNPPDHLFCHDGFHPSTVGQALIANQILDAINRATGGAIPLMSNREIIGEVLGLNPDQPYLDWAGAAGGMTGNPDGDGLPNLAEYLFGTSPLAGDSPFRFGPGGRLSFTPGTEGGRFAQLQVEESGTLAGWQAVPAARISVAADGTWSVEPDGTGKGFYRVVATPRP